MNTSIEYVTMPAALRVASSISVITLLRGSLGSSSPVAVPRSFSYWPTLPKLRPPKAADWPGNMLGACERAGSQVTLVMRASAMSGATAKAAVIASAIVLMNDLLYLPKPLPGLSVIVVIVLWPLRFLTTISRRRGGRRHRDHRGRRGGRRRTARPGACQGAVHLDRLQTSATAWACLDPLPASSNHRRPRQTCFADAPTVRR